MLRKIVKVLIWLLLALAAFMAFNTWRNWEVIQRVFLGGVKSLRDHSACPAREKY